MAHKDCVWKVDQTKDLKNINKNVIDLGGSLVKIIGGATPVDVSTNNSISGSRIRAGTLMSPLVDEGLQGLGDITIPASQPRQLSSSPPPTKGLPSQRRRQQTRNIPRRYVAQIVSACTKDVRLRRGRQIADFAWKTALSV